jgi:hypothetical protein
LTIVVSTTISRALAWLTVDATVAAGATGATFTAGATGDADAEVPSGCVPAAGVGEDAVALDDGGGAGGGITKRWNKNSTRKESVIAKRTLRSIFYF